MRDKKIQTLAKRKRRWTLPALVLFAMAVTGLVSLRVYLKEGSLFSFTRLTDIGDLKGLHKGSPVRLRGIVTYYDFDSQSLYVQDSTGAVGIHSLGHDWQLHPGQRIEVSANTTQDFDAKIGPDSVALAQVSVKVLGTAPLPSPVQVSLNGLSAQERTSERVEVHGIVRAASKEDGRLILDFSPKDEGPHRGRRLWNEPFTYR